jgi:hypothetical protein
MFKQNRDVRETPTKDPNKEVIMLGLPNNEDKD